MQLGGPCGYAEAAAAVRLPPVAQGTECGRVQRPSDSEGSEEEWEVQREGAFAPPLPLYRRGYNT